MTPENQQFIKGLTKYANSISDWRKTFGEKPEKELSKLLKKYEVFSDTCLTLIDLKKLDIIFAHGTSRLFGITEAEFAIPQFTNLIHPAFRSIYYAKALAVLGAIGKFKAFINLETPYCYNIFLILKLRDGKYYRVRQHSLPFGLDKNGNMALQLNIYYTGLEPFLGQSVTSFFSYSGKEFSNHFTQAMEQAHRSELQKVLKNNPELSPTYKKGWGFTKREMDLLQIVASNSKFSFTEIGKKMKVSERTARGFWLKDGVKSKMNRIFHPAEFNTVQDAAIFFKQMDILL